MAPISGSGPLPLLIAVVSLVDRLYSGSMVPTSRPRSADIPPRDAWMFSRLLMSISIAVLVRTRALPVRVSDNQWYTHTESVFTCNTLLCHWRAKLTPFNTASSSTKLICWVSFCGRSQQTSSSTVMRLSKATPIAREQISTHTFGFGLSTHQFLRAGSSHCTEPTVSDTVHWKRASLVSSSQPFVTKLALLLSIPQATRSQVHTRGGGGGGYPTSLIHRENIVGNHDSSHPSQFTLFYRDRQFQHSYAVL